MVRLVVSKSLSQDRKPSQRIDARCLFLTSFLGVTTKREGGFLDLNEPKRPIGDGAAAREVVMRCFAVQAFTSSKVRVC